MSKPIYLDYNATTPIDPRVLEAMMPYLTQKFGNPASVNHSYGWETREAIDKARQQVASLIGCQPKNIIWTSGATESNNIALQSFCRPELAEGKDIHIVTTEMEHKAVLDVVQSLGNCGAKVTFVKSDRYGMIQPEAIEAAIQPNTKVISVIMGQNEIGTINPVEKIGAIAKAKGILFHVDAAQTLGKIEIDVQKMNISMLSASGHKIYAPKGVGVLYISDSVHLEPIFQGGKQEKCIRPGTHNVPAIVAMGEACEIASREMIEESLRLTKWRDQFIERLLKASDRIKLNGHPTKRLSSNINISFQDFDSSAFELHLGGLAVSSGSACSTGESSYILKAIGSSPELAKASIRFGIGRFTKEQDLISAGDMILKMLKIG